MGQRTGSREFSTVRTVRLHGLVFGLSVQVESRAAGLAREGHRHLVPSTIEEFGSVLVEVAQVVPDRLVAVLAPAHRDQLVGQARIVSVAHADCPVATCVGIVPAQVEDGEATIAFGLDPKATVVFSRAKPRGLAREMKSSAPSNS